MKGTKMGMNVNPTRNKQALYTVNNDGAIEINSIKDKSIFQIAKSYDSNHNALLENDEIGKFLSKYKPVNENDNYYVYYQENARDGKLLKRCFLMKSDNSQLRYSYKNGKPYICVITMTDGTKMVMHLEKGKAHYYDNPTEPLKYKTYTLNSENIENLSKIGLEQFDDDKKTNESLLKRIADWTMNWHK